MTVTVVLQYALLPSKSAAVQVIIYVPGEYLSGWLHVSDWMPTLSRALGWRDLNVSRCDIVTFESVGHETNSGNVRSVTMTTTVACIQNVIENISTIKTTQ